MGYGVSDISALANLTNLRYLAFSYNDICDISALASLTKIEYLDLSNNHVRDISVVGGFPNIGYVRANSQSIYLDIIYIHAGEDVALENVIINKNGSYLAPEAINKGGTYVSPTLTWGNITESTTLKDTFYTSKGLGAYYYNIEGDVEQRVQESFRERYIFR